MATADSPGPRRPRGRPRGRVESLIDWHDPDRNAHVLDWRQRAHEFGLVPVGDDADDSTAAVPDAPERLLHEEEPEAFEDQPSARPTRSLSATATTRSRPVPRTPTSIPRAHLSDAHRAAEAAFARDEQEIGRRIEVARSELLAEISAIPCALQTLTALADEIAAGTTPAAELILLPDGGELKPENIQPVLKAFARVRRLQKAGDEDGADEDTIAATLRDLPIRPSVLDDIVAELRRADEAFERAGRDRAGDAERRALEVQTGLPRRVFRQRFARVREREDAVMMPSAN